MIDWKKTLSKTLTRETKIPSSVLSKGFPNWLDVPPRMLTPSFSPGALLMTRSYITRRIKTKRNSNTPQSQIITGVVATKGGRGDRWFSPHKISSCKKILCKNSCPKMQNTGLKTPICKKIRAKLNSGAFHQKFVAVCQNYVQNLKSCNVLPRILFHPKTPLQIVTSDHQIPPV